MFAPGSMSKFIGDKEGSTSGDKEYNMPLSVNTNAGNLAQFTSPKPIFMGHKKNPSGTASLKGQSTASNEEGSN